MAWKRKGLTEEGKKNSLISRKTLFLVSCKRKRERERETSVLSSKRILQTILHRTEAMQGKRPVSQSIDHILHFLVL
jgi:hypothetical protein